MIDLPALRDCLDRPIRLAFTTEAGDRLRVGEHIFDPDGARELARVLLEWANRVDDGWAGTVVPPPTDEAPVRWPLDQDDQTEETTGGGEERRQPTEADALIVDRPPATEQRGRQRARKGRQG